MKPVRKQRVAALLRNEIARVIQQELRDPRIGFVSVLSVEPTEDLKEAKVSVSILGDESQQRTSLRGLQAARGFIQAHLGRVTRFRESIRRTMEIEERIRQVRADDATRHPEAAEATEPTEPDPE